MYGSLMGKVLHVDLDGFSIEEIDILEKIAETFMGGLPLCIRVAYDFIKPKTDPFSPENPVVIGAGCLVGTIAPASSRVYAVTKLPVNGAVGWGGAGGMTFGYNLKSAGYDCIVITGKADSPVYLEIEDEKAYIQDGRKLWGRSVDECCNLLWEEKSGGIISIGQAGENRVRFSMAYVDRISTLGRGGLAAVLGSKMLKAIVVRGNRGVKVAKRREFAKLCDSILEKMRGYPYLKEWQELGLLKSLPFLPRELYLKMRKKRIACISCPIGDKELIAVDDVKAYTSSIVNLLTPVVVGMNYRDAIKLVSRLDGYGLDVFEFLGVLEMAKKLEYEVDFTSLKSMLEWAEKIAFRKEEGAELAEGSGYLVEKYGVEGKSVVKGMRAYVTPSGFLTWNLFGTMELGQILDPRGPHIAASGSPTYFAKRDIERFRKHLLRMGLEDEKIEEILSGGIKIGKLLCYSNIWFTILASLGICARAQINRFYSAEICSKLYEAATGFEGSVKSLMERARNAWSLMRHMNLREGFSSKDDRPPKDWFGDAGFKEYVTEKPLSEEEIEEMIRDYYREMGWSDRGEPGKIYGL